MPSLPAFNQGRKIFFDIVEEAQPWRKAVQPREQIHRQEGG
jgi:hypothetical protein